MSEIMLGVLRMPDELFWNERELYRRQHNVIRLEAANEIERLRAEVASLRQQQSWIAVETRKPTREESSSLIAGKTIFLSVIDDSGESSCISGFYCHDEDMFFTADGDSAEHLCIEVTHWMPQPEPADGVDILPPPNLLSSGGGIPRKSSKASGKPMTTTNAFDNSSAPVTLSLLVPAYNAEAYLPSLVQSLLAQAGTEHPIEIVISPDCEADYPALLPNDSRIRFCESGVASGPSVARNRALDAARGTHFIQMDADDTVSDNYLDSIFAGLARHNCVAARSVYYEGEQPVKRYEGDHVSLPKFLDFYGSVLVAMPRAWLTHYPDVVAEDGLALLVALNRMQGQIPVIDGTYNIRLHGQSVCALIGSAFTMQYRKALSNASFIAGSLGLPGLEADITELYETRKTMSKAYDSHCAAQGGLSYHAFVQQMQRSIKIGNTK